MTSKKEEKNIEELKNQIIDEAKEYYTLDIDVYMDNDKIINWLLGLSSGGFLVSLSLLTKENKNLICPIFYYACIAYSLVIIAGIIEKIAAKGIKIYGGIAKSCLTLSRISMHGDLLLSLKEFTSSPINIIYDKLLTGQYFSDVLRRDFFVANLKFKKSHKVAGISFLLIIIFLMVQFIFIFLFYMKSINASA